MARKTKKTEAPEMVLNVLSNDPQEFHYDMLQLFYKGALENTLALMEALNSETGEKEMVLVGMVYRDDTYDAYPIASILSPEHSAKLLGPDGKGNYGTVAGA